MSNLGKEQEGHNGKENEKESWEAECINPPLCSAFISVSLPCPYVPIFSFPLFLPSPSCGSEEDLRVVGGPAAILSFPVSSPCPLLLPLSSLSVPCTAAATTAAHRRARVHTWARWEAPGETEPAQGQDARMPPASGQLRVMGASSESYKTILYRVGSSPPPGIETQIAVKPMPALLCTVHFQNVDLHILLLLALA